MAQNRNKSTRDRLLAAAVAGAGASLVAWLLARRREQPEATYPPLDTPKPVADGVWVVDSGPLRVAGLELPVRMTVIRLANGDLLLHSPTRFTPDLARELALFGTVRHLVAPNIAHWTFLPDWQRAFPEATTWAAPGLKERAQVRASGVRIDRELEGRAPPAWDGEVAQGVVPGAGGFHEVWFLHRASRTLLLVDLIENLEPKKMPLVGRAVMRAGGATEGTTPRHLRAVLRLGGQETKDAIRTLLATEPERVVFAHGAWFADRGAERLRRGLSWLV